MVKRVPALLACGVWMIAWWALYPTLGPKIKAYGLSRLGPTADYFFTYFGPELLIFLFGLVVLPLLYFIFIRRGPWWAQAALVPAVLVGFIFVAYYDVVKIAREAEHLCTTEAGLHVYETVEAEGLYGLSDIRYWSKYGFKWLEYTDVVGKNFRSRLDGKEIVREEINSPQSVYEYRVESHRPISQYLEKSRQLILNRSSGSILSEVTYFHIFRGWADRLIDVGFKFIPPICWHGPPVLSGDQSIRGGSRFVKLTLLPK